MDFIWIKENLLPHYDEMTLYLHGLAFLSLFVFGIGFYEFFSTFGFFNVLMILGALITIFYAFSNKPKNAGEKYIMLWFMILLNAYASCASAFIVISRNLNYLYLILPLINIFHTIIIIIMYRNKKIDYKNISDENVNIKETIIGGLALLTLVLICSFVFRLYWTFTLSISVGYINSVYRILQKTFRSRPLI